MFVLNSSFRWTIIYYLNSDFKFLASFLPLCHCFYHFICLFKVNKINVKTNQEIVLVSLLLIVNKFIPCFDVSTVDFKQVNARRDKVVKLNFPRWLSKDHAQKLEVMLFGWRVDRVSEGGRNEGSGFFFVLNKAKEAK